MNGQAADPRLRRSKPLLGASAAAALGLVWAFEPLSAGSQAPVAADRVKAADAFELAAAALGPRPTSMADEGGMVEMIVAVPAGGDIAALLVRAGAARREAELAAGRMPDIGPGSELAILLGDKGPGGRIIKRVELRDGFGNSLNIVKSAGGNFTAGPPRLSPEAYLRRIRGQAGRGLYWSLRAAGVTGQAAEEYLEAILIDAPGEGVGEADRFDLVLSGERLLYAALERNRGASVQLVKWPIGTSTQWLRPDARPARAGGGLMRPVAGAVTSAFGYRVHPILRFGRLHRGVDFQASWGTPVRAAADGLVGAAGWNGGYGRQVRIAHAGGVETSYSHLSSLAAEQGDRIRRGQVIGYVGSSGLSTGAHLHYEMIAGGRAVDPLSAAQPEMQGMTIEDMVRMRQWVARLRAIEPRPAA